MTEGVIAIEHDATIREAAEKMRDEDIRSLVVVEEDEAVGIVVGRDVIYQVIADEQDPDATPVSDVMTDNLVTATEGDNIEDIARAMIRNDISRVPVLRGENLVGMVTQSNLVRAWPSYIDLLQEETHAFSPDEPVDNVETSEGLCDSCENYSTELVNVDGELLCPECRESGLR